MLKFFFTFDNTKKAKKLKKIFLRNNINYPLKKSDLIVVGGGDGFMLHTIKKFIHYNKPFYGINCGSYGFLMNKGTHKNFFKRISSSKKFFLNPLEVTIKKKKMVKKLLAINEVSLLRQSRQTASLKIRINKRLVLKRLIGDGILVSTPAGSTAYNLSVNGPIMSLDSNKISVKPISPFRPRRWKGVMCSNASTIYIKNLDIKKRPVSSVSDNVEIRNIQSLKVKISKKNIFCLMFDKNRSLDKRNKLEQIIKRNKLSNEL